jgi:hypothetical protein
MNQQTMKRGDTDNTMTYLVIGIVLFFISSFLINKYSVAFYGPWKIVMLPLAKFSLWLSTGFLGEMLNPLLRSTSLQAQSLVHFLQNTPANQFTTQGFMVINHFIGKHLLVILFPLGAYATITTFRSTQGLSKPFQRFVSASALKAYALTSKDKACLSLVDDDSLYGGKMASAMSCLQFCEANNIISYAEDKKNIEIVEQEKAYTAFVKQLGKRFTTKEAFLASELSWLVNKLINSIPEKHREDALAFALSGHLYESTAFISLLFVAKRFGVVSSRLFLTLKTTHRALWYAVVNCGRQTVFVEGAGIIAQFDHELTCKLDKNPIDPKSVNVNAAIKGVLQALDEESLETPWNVEETLWDNFDPMRY